jgi:hypothetical protein
MQARVTTMMICPDEPKTAAPTKLQATGGSWRSTLDRRVATECYRAMKTATTEIVFPAMVAPVPAASNRTLLVPSPVSRANPP